MTFWESYRHARSFGKPFLVAFRYAWERRAV